METLYGRNPKLMMCGCNAVENTEEVVTIGLNDRCPVCMQQFRIAIPKREIKVKQVPSVVGPSLQVA